MSKDLWFSEMERLLAEKQDAGMSLDQAYEQAADEAHGALTERLADIADLERKRRREEER